MIKNTLLLLLSLLLALALVEGAVRLMTPAPTGTMDFFRLTQTEFYQRDPVVGWKPKPDVSGQHNQPGSFKSSFTTNSLGLRDTEPDGPESARQRIVVLGDSFAWGWGVNDGEVFTDRLEAEMQGTEIINLGVTGFATQQQRLLLQQLGLGLQPDMIVLAFCQNDVIEVERDFLSPPPVRPTSKTAPPFSLKALLADNLATYRLVTQAINSNRTMIKLMISIGLKDELGGYETLDVNLRPSLKDYPPKLATQWRLAEVALGELAQLADSHDIPLVIVAVPALQSVVQAALMRSLVYTRYEPDDFDLDKPYTRLAKLSAKLGVRFINPLSDFRVEAENGAKLYFDGDMHFNPTGHDLFARVIAAELAAED